MIPQILAELLSGDLLRVFWLNYCDAVAEFRAEKCSEYCRICGNNCCTGRLNPEFNDLRAFSHLKRVRYRWHRPPEGGEPYLIDRSILVWKSFFLVRACPHLKDNLCSIYSDKGRPRVCDEYPVYLQTPFSVPFLRPFISVELSCAMCKYSQNCEEISRFAEKLGLDVVFHPASE